MEKSLDQKILEIRGNPGSKEFIIADAKDADMAFGIAATGPPDGYRHPSIQEYQQRIRLVIQQGVVDIVLMSASNAELLAHHEPLFNGSPITPAARANDASDIWISRGGVYAQQPSLPFRTATLDGMQSSGIDLGLYSVTFNNDAERDHATLTAYNEFRIEAESKGFRYILEVFNPNVPGAVAPDVVGHFLNDHIARMLAGVGQGSRPLFLKIPYHSPAVLEELIQYDSNLIVGILGGASGTTYDAFKLLADAQKYGARAALFGRKINNAEDPLAFIERLRHIADGDENAEEAVRHYHDALERNGIRPARPLDEDSQLVTHGVH